jgi:uncharacterized protein YndB with AHSA1/START domain
VPNIIHRIGVNAEPPKVFAVLTTQEDLANWWTRTVRAAPQVGAILEFLTS